MSKPRVVPDDVVKVSEPWYQVKGACRPPQKPRDPNRCTVCRDWLPEDARPGQIYCSKYCRRYARRFVGGSTLLREYLPAPHKQPRKGGLEASQPLQKALIDQSPTEVRQTYRYCKFCGAELPAKARSSRKYCNATCRVAAMRVRQRDSLTEEGEQRSKDSPEPSQPTVPEAPTPQRRDRGSHTPS